MAANPADERALRDALDSASAAAGALRDALAEARLGDAPSAVRVHALRANRQARALIVRLQTVLAQLLPANVGGEDADRR